MTLDYLSELRAQGIVISLTDDGSQLKVNAPKGAITPDLGAGLKARRDEILAFLREASRSSVPALPPLTPVDRSAPLVLSHAQERVWKLHQVAPDSTAMNVPVAWEIVGSLDIAALEAALGDVAGAHEMLRTRFRGRASAPELHIEPQTDSSVPLDHHDFRVGGRAAALDAAERLAVAPIDISGRGVMRAHVLRFGADAWLLVLVFHQIGFDWGAAGPVARDLGWAYTARVDGRPAMLTPPDFAYVDYASWQRSMHTDGLLTPQDDYWRDRFDAPVASLALPHDRARPPLETFAGDRVSFAISAEQTEPLLALARGSGASLYMGLLAVLHSVSTGYAGQDDGVVFSMLGMSSPELKQMVGLFANPLPLRIDSSGDPSFASLLARTQDATIGAFGNQDLPFEHVVKHLRAVPGSVHQGFFQLLFIYQHEPTPPLQLDGAQTSLVTLGLHAPAFDVRVFAEPKDGGLHGWIEYKSDLFDSATIERFRDLLVATVGAVVADPDAPLSTVMPFQEADRVDPASLLVGPEAEYVAPRTNTETTLLGLWEEALGRDHISVYDNFFSIGGHSLVALSVFAEIKEATGRDLPLATLFHSPTIAALAAVLDDDDWSLDFTSLVPIQPTGTERPLFCVAALGDEVVQFGELARLLDPNQPFYALQQGVERAEFIHTDIRALAAHYLGELREIQPHGPYRIAGYCFGGMVAFEMAHQLRAAGEEIEILFQIEADIPGSIRPRSREDWDVAPGEMPSYIEQRSRFRHLRRKAWKRLQYDVWGAARRPLHRAYVARGRRLPRWLRDIIAINSDAQDAYLPTMQRYEGDIELLRAEYLLPNWDYDENLGWNEFIGGEIRTSWIPGDHEGVWKSPAVEVFAAHVSRMLGQSSPVS